MIWDLKFEIANLDTTSYRRSLGCRNLESRIIKTKILIALWRTVAKPKAKAQRAKS